jgi:hypothetical protein
VRFASPQTNRRKPACRPNSPLGSQASRSFATLHDEDSHCDRLWNMCGTADALKRHHFIPAHCTMYRQIIHKHRCSRSESHHQSAQTTLPAHPQGAANPDTTGAPRRFQLVWVKRPLFRVVNPPHPPRRPHYRNDTPVNQSSRHVTTAQRIEGRPVLVPAQHTAAQGWHTMVLTDRPVPGPPAFQATRRTADPPLRVPERWLLESQKLAGVRV